jgi:hypothetical protein
VDAQAEAAAVKKPVKSATDELVEESRRLIEMSRTLRDLDALQIAESEEAITDSRRILARAAR